MPNGSTKKHLPADTQPKLRVVAHNARLEEALQSEISGQLASVLKTNPKLTTHQALWRVQEQILANNPWEPPKNGKSPINDLPNEILAYIFSIGVKEEQEGEEEEYEDEDDEDEWEDTDTDSEFDDDETEASSPLAPGGSPVESDSDDDDDSDTDVDDDGDSDNEPSVPFQILVSHVCHRWREVALESYILWTTLDFTNRLRLEQARMYIARSGGLPLNILIDCTFPENVDEEDHPDHPLYHENKKKFAEDGEDGADKMDDGDDDEYDYIQFLSQNELAQILDLIEPEVSQWGVFQFHASTYGYIHLLMSRLHKLPSAPLLETFEVCHFEDCDDYEVFNGDDKTSFLPFHGNAPLLKEAVLWGVHIDWDASLSSFLRGLLVLELSYHAKDVRPSYKTFKQIINNSPELHTLTLSLSGPALRNGLPHDVDIEEGGWGTTPLTILSLKELALQFHDSKYASALVNHLDVPNVTSLLLNFEEEDYSEFVAALLNPVKGRTKNLLTNIEHMKISGLPCNVYSAETLLGQLGNLKSLNIKVMGLEESIIFQKLVDPYAGRLPVTPGTDANAGAEAPQQQQQQAPAAAAPHTTGLPPPTSTPSASSSSPISPIPNSNAPLPALFCPRLEGIVTNRVFGMQVKKLILARRKLGVPLKRVSMSQIDPLSAKEERWIRANVEEFDFFVPSDSEEESETDEDEDGEDGSEDDDADDDDDEDDDEDDEDDDEDDGDENQTPQTALFSPLARHLGRGRRGRHHRSMDLD